MVILTGVNNTAVVVVKIGCFIPVSLTPVRYYYTGVVDTGEYYQAGVVDTGEYYSILS